MAGMRDIVRAEVAARQTLAQDRCGTVTNLRPRKAKPYDGAGDELRQATLDVLSWSVLLADAERPDAAEGVRLAAKALRDRLQHPAAQVKP